MQNDFLKKLVEYNTVVLVAGVFVAMWLAWSTVSVIEKNYTLQQEVDALEEEVALIELENETLRLNIQYYTTDEYLEVAARDKFNKQAKGEQSLAISQDAIQRLKHEPVPLVRPAAEDRSEYVKNLDQWLFFLFDKEPSGGN